jgi:7-keto-8-aminopelargonate synthetase-like enzyme
LAPGHPSPIVPYVLGSEERALAAAAALLERGLLVTAIRPPTVPPGTARLRVTLSAAHTPDQVDRLAAALAQLFPPAA